MEIMRPQNIGGSLLPPCIKGKIRITTRCLWLDNGKLLDALYKAAHVALSSCPANCPLAHMERTVSEVLKKMVRKYSSKRPEVVAIAVENANAVLAEEMKTRLSGKSKAMFSLSALKKSVDPHVARKKFNQKLNEADTSSSRQAEESEDVEDLDGDNLLKRSASASLSEESASYLDSIQMDNMLEPVDAPGPLVSAGAHNGSIAEENLRNDESVNSSTSKSKRAEPQPALFSCAKRQKWKPEEIVKLIKIRSDMDSRFQTVRSRMVLWGEISAKMLDYGMERSPAQCKSLWASLVQKYEEQKSGADSTKNWPYFDEMDMFSVQK